MDPQAASAAAEENPTWGELIEEVDDDTPVEVPVEEGAEARVEDIIAALFAALFSSVEIPTTSVGTSSVPSSTYSRVLSLPPFSPGPSSSGFPPQEAGLEEARSLAEHLFVD